MTKQALNENELTLFVDSVRNYFRVTTQQEPQITSAYLGTRDVQGFEFNGLVNFSGPYSGHILVSMPAPLLRELLLMQHETVINNSNLLDAAGEVANTLAGNARKIIGPTLEISVPVTLQGVAGIRARVRERPYVITLNWNRQPALVFIDMEKRT
jgi:chemotaxis protein CheX